MEIAGVEETTTLAECEIIRRPCPTNVCEVRSTGLDTPRLLQMRPDENTQYLIRP